MPRGMVFCVGICYDRISIARQVISLYFAYGEAELSYLRQKDARLGAVIDRIGPIERAVDPDLFSSVIHHIIGQQISMKAQATIWQRMQDALGAVNAETILAAGVPALQALGMTFRKAEYITDFAEKVHTGAFDLDAVAHMRDEDAIRELSSLKGIGVWTAEMILLFCLQRPDIFSYDDLAIQRGLRMVYHHRKIDRGIVAGVAARIPFFFFEDWRRTLPDALLGGFAVGGGLLAFVLLYEKLRRVEAMGGGDLKLLFVTGLWLGWAKNLLCLLLACVLGIAFGLATQKRRAAQENAKLFPWGPSICAAGIVTMLAGDTVIAAYVSMF